MTYRSDHDAALNRLDALERELAELRADRAAEPIALPPAPPRRSRAWLVLGLFSWVAATGIAAVKLVGGASDGPASAAPASHAGEAPPPARTDRAELRACARNTVALAPCRPLLHLHDSLDLTPDERGLVAMWARTEDALVLATAELASDRDGALRTRYETLVVERGQLLRELAL